MENQIVESTYPKSRLVFSVILMGLACFLMAEGVARIRSGPTIANARYIEISSGFPDLDTLIKDAQNMPGVTFYDEYLIAPRPYASTHINFTDYYSARLTPDSAPLWQAEHVIWAFGNSTMQNTETTDSLSMANTWAKVFSEALGPTHVKNFGSGTSLSSYELIKFQKLLREVPGHELPTIAVFYDGYTDAWNGYQDGPGRLQTDLSLKLQALVNQDYIVTAVYAISAELSHYSEYWEQRVAPRIERRLFPPPQPSAAEENIAAAVRIYTSNVRMIEATCQIYGIDCFFVLQPLLATKNPLSEPEQGALAKIEAHPRMGPEGIRFVREFYARIVEELAGHQSFIDVSDILDGRAQPDFYDFGHVGALTPPAIGEKVARLILGRMEETGAASGDTAYTVTESDWFFSPGNWHKSRSDYALTSSPGAYCKFRFRGIGLKLGIDLTAFQRTSPNAPDYPRLRWRIDGGPWMEQLTASGMRGLVLARGLELTDHTLEVYFESVQRNRDRWDNPVAAVSFTNATVLDGKLLSPALRSQRWIAFGNSMTEGVVCHGASYGSTNQCASRTWSILVGEQLDAEVGVVGFTSQGYGTPGVAVSHVPEFHTTSGQTWDELYYGESRNYRGIDAVLVSHVTNDVALSDADLEAYVRDFLGDFRTANADITIFLIVPFGGARRTQITTAFSAYQSATPDARCYLIDITDVDPILTEDLDGDAAFSTFSYDGLHPNLVGHDRIADLVSRAIEALGIYGDERSPAE